MFALFFNAYMELLPLNNTWLSYYGYLLHLSMFSAHNGERRKNTCSHRRMGWERSQVIELSPLIVLTRKPE